MEDKVCPGTRVWPKHTPRPGIPANMVIQAIETFSNPHNVIPMCRSHVVLHETSHAWMIEDPLSWETEPPFRADGWPTRDGGGHVRALASTEPDLDTRLCVRGVVAGTAELKDAVFTHTVLE